MGYGYNENEKFYKKLGISLFLISLIWAVIDISVGVYGWYKYDNTIQSYWSLADKASTIEQKSVYLDKYVTVLENSGLNGQYDALFMNTPDNSFDKNLEALKSLQTRLGEIQGMDPKSFEYNTAITQITAQEQGEAYAMISVFSGVWWKVNHFLLWSWVCGINVVLCIFTFIIGIRYWNYGNW